MPPLRQKLVLVVDDTPTEIAVISGVLKDSFRIKVATNGKKALAMARASDKPDLILLDVVMPGMDGFEVCRHLKATPTTREIPVIFLTGVTDAENEEKGFEIGAVDYIHKPFSAPIVLARVKNSTRPPSCAQAGARSIAIRPTSCSTPCELNSQGSRV